MKITLAQIEPITGDLDGNIAKIAAVLEEHAHTSDVIIFPELAVTGYNCGSDFESEEFIEDAYYAIHQHIFPRTGKAAVILGAPTFAPIRREKNGAIRLHNSALLLRNQQLLGIYDKTLLANDAHHEDRKYFLPGERGFLTFEAAGELCGVLICEDIWSDDHDRNLVEEMKQQYPALSTLLVVNCSYFTSEKLVRRLEIATRHCQENGIGLVYLNASAIGDIVKNIIVYDGHSFVMNRYGELAALLPAFEAKVETIDFAPEKRLGYDIQVSDSPEIRLERTWEAMLFATRRLFDITGIPNAQVHISGGLDSAIVGTLAVMALGKERVRFITNPSQCNGAETLRAAQQLADALNMELLSIPVQGLANALVTDCDDAFAVHALLDKAPCDVPMVWSTAHAVGRTTIGLAMCHYHQAAIIATGNHTENVLGWANFHDIGSVGLFQPIGDLTKLELFHLARYINYRYAQDIRYASGIIPVSLYDGSIKPAAELPDAKEDPFDYNLVSGICAEIVRHRKTRRQLYQEFSNRTLNLEYFPGVNVYDYDTETWRKAVDVCWTRSRSQSVFKMAQAAPVLILSPRSRGFSSRETIITRYKG